MKKITLALLFLFYMVIVYAQDCTFYYPQKQGAQLEYKNYDSKDKLSGSSIQLIKEYKETGNKLEAVIEAQTFDKKGKDLGKKEFKVKCEGGVYSVDMKSFMDSQTMEAYKEMDVEINGNNLEIPAKLNVGDNLADGKLEMTISSEGVKIMGMTTNITQRKVETKEEIATEAGTFNCYKITYTMTVKTMFSVRMEAAEWIAEGVGMVKSETYSNGKTMGYTLLAGLKK